MNFERRRIYFFRGRLAQFQHSASDSLAWDQRWDTIDLKKQYHLAEKGNLGVYRSAFIHYLPDSGLLLEAGCGTGRYVKALKVLGYSVIGLDWALATLGKAKHIWPQAPFINANIMNLPLPNTSVKAIISLGVIEHFLEPWQFLVDSVRVLQPGGILYLVVPYVNAIRRWNARRGRYPIRDDETDFYQYLMKENEIESALMKLGLKILDNFATSAYSGLIDEYPTLDRWFRHLPLSHQLINRLNYNRYLGKLSGHIIHYIAQKEKQ